MATKGNERIRFTKRTRVAARKGMRSILESHEPLELRNVCGELGVGDHGLSHAERVDLLMTAECKDTYRGYRRVLNVVWDAILLQELRRVGKRLKSVNDDPRALLLRLWTKDTQSKVKGFGRNYLPVTTDRDAIRFWREEDDAVHWYLQALQEKERSAKRLEKTLTSSDYESIMLFFTLVAELRELEKEFREVLMEEGSFGPAEAVWRASLKHEAHQTGVLERLSLATCSSLP